MVPGLEVFPRVSSAVILTDRVAVILRILGYLFDSMGVIFRDRKTEKGEMCSLRVEGEAENCSLEKTGKGGNRKQDSLNGKRSW